MKNILVPMADGNEDIELITILDVLTRVKNAGASINIIPAGLNSLDVELDTGLMVKASVLLDDVDVASLDAIALAGGFGGMNNFKNDERIINILKTLHAKGKIVAAICASPIVLDKAGVLSDEFACYPGCEEGLVGKRIDDAVVVRGNVITSTGPITSAYFALSIVRELGFSKEVDAVSKGMLIDKYKISK